MALQAYCLKVKEMDDMEINAAVSELISQSRVKLYSLYVHVIIT